MASRVFEAPAAAAVPLFRDVAPVPTGLLPLKVVVTPNARFLDFST